MKNVSNNRHSVNRKKLTAIRVKRKPMTVIQYGVVSFEKARKNPHGIRKTQSGMTVNEGKEAS